MKKQIRRLTRLLLRYATVSAIATTTSLVVLGALVAGRITSPSVANVIATACGVVPSFELNRRWVWGRAGRRSLSREVVPFCGLTLAGLALSTVSVWVVGAWTGSWSAGPRTLAVQAANLVAFGLVWVVQFVVLDRILFRPRPVELAPPVDDHDDAALAA